MLNFLKKIVTQSAITVLVPELGRPVTLSSDHRLFSQLEQAVAENDLDKVKRIVNQAEEVVLYTKGRVTVKNGQVFINTPDGQEPVAGPIVERICSAMMNDKDDAPIVQFLDNLAANPSSRARDELHGFLENTRLPISDDGRFMAYKWVKYDYWDSYTGSTYMNKPGHIIRMARHKVNDNPRETCSHGLHVCGKDYTAFSDRLMLVAIDPRDVVSVPVDYNANKMRVCQYEVIAEIAPEDYTKEIYENMDIYSIEEIREAHLKQLEEARDLQKEFFDEKQQPDQDVSEESSSDKEKIIPSGTIQERVPFTDEEWEFFIKQVRNKRAYAIIKKRFPEKEIDDLKYYANLIRRVDRGEEQLKFVCKP